jgi:hypothetical protein
MGLLALLSLGSLHSSISKFACTDTALPLSIIGIISDSEILSSPNSRLIWSRTDSQLTLNDLNPRRLRRTVHGFGGRIEECGALGLTNSTDEDVVENEQRHEPRNRAEEVTASVPPEPAVDCPTSISGHTVPPSSTLFDADFNLTFDPASGQWLVSNVNVLRR